ncbi:MAG: hypothetical protein D4R79_20205 [Comamonadaceae bacterium]|nr:MAG: hypothetical protein D4R79_20205 [Comamonadaceae bacterium]
MYEVSVQELKETADVFSHIRNGRIGVEYISYEFSVSSDVLLVPISEVIRPNRNEGRIWFRSKENMEDLLQSMIARDCIPPINVFSKNKGNFDCYIVRDGFHRYYASLALGYKFIPIEINNWDFEDAN